jgi:hypothetical protein
VADGGSIKDYDLKILGKETIQIELGDYHTTVLERTTDSKTTTWWCAQELHYLPVKIRQVKKDGGSVMVVLYKLEGIQTEN